MASSRMFKELQLKSTGTAAKILFKIRSLWEYKYYDAPNSKRIRRSEHDPAGCTIYSEGFPEKIADIDNLVKTLKSAFDEIVDYKLYQATTSAQREKVKSDLAARLLDESETYHNVYSKQGDEKKCMGIEYNISGFTEVDNDGHISYYGNNFSASFPKGLFLNKNALYQVIQSVMYKDFRQLMKPAAREKAIWALGSHLEKKTLLVKKGESIHPFFTTPHLPGIVMNFLKPEETKPAVPTPAKK